ncbi:MAG: exo-beta-N-acetylmuramidase NamZ family protein [Bacteroidota bacterium]
MKKMILFLLIAVSILLAKGPQKVIVGADMLFESRTDLIDGKRVGLITNHTALLADGTHLADALHDYPDAKLVALFGPEHGIRGDASDGSTVNDTIDAKTGVPVYSLYGKVNKPTPEMLKNVDVLVYDIQDVGARFYTFISTMFLCMEAAAEQRIPFVVLDRPNPIGGVKSAGPIRLDSLKTFVGWAPIPIMHGMTVGELAVMANLQGWLKDRKTAKLTVVKMENWRRSQWYDETKLDWIKPSPNMKTLQTATIYPGMCLLEGTNVSEGRGTELPFENIGAPWIDGKDLAKQLNMQGLAGVRFEPTEFTPQEIPNVASHPKYAGQLCGGVVVNVTDRKKFDAVKCGIAVVSGIHSLYKDSLRFRERGFDRLAGTPVIRQSIIEGKNAGEIVALWRDELDEFNKLRYRSFLYTDK